MDSAARDGGEPASARDGAASAPTATPTAAAPARGRGDAGSAAAKAKLDAGKHPASAEAAAGCFSRWTFRWVSNLMDVGYHQPLQDADLWDLPPNEGARGLVNAFRAHQRTHALQAPAAVGDAATGPTTTQPAQQPEHLAWTLMRMTRSTLLMSSGFMAVYATCQLGTPLLLRAMVESIDRGDDQGLLIALAMFVVGIAGGLFNQQQFHINFRVGQRLRATVIALVYEKAMTLTTTERKGLTSGEIINLLSADAQKLFDLMPYIHVLWSAPVQSAIAIYFLIQLLGESAAAGVAVLFLLVPINILTTRALGKMRGKHMAVSDVRMKLCAEVLQAIRVVKFFEWTEEFASRIMRHREKELQWTRSELRLFAFTIFLLITFPIIGVVATFAAFVANGHLLTAGIAFSALAFFNVLRFPLQFLSLVVSTAVQAWVALRRLDAFLRLNHLERRSDRGAITRGAAFAAATTGSEAAVADNEADASAISSSDVIIGMSEAAAAAVARDEPLVDVRNATFAWATAAPPQDAGGSTVRGAAARATSTDSSRMRAKTADSALSDLATADAVSEWFFGQPFRLTNFGVTIRAGQLAVIVGPVGGGKSTAVNGILGEALTVSGSMRLTGRVAFAPQSAWVQNATLRENVLFGLPFDEKRYRQVLTAVALWQDLKELPASDMTVIGEKGVTLSGGQKARVSLARAAYSNPDVLIMDDVMSALDAHTARTVFDLLIGPSGMLAHKARLLVTHATHYLAQADCVVVVHEGSTSFTGTYDELMAATRDADAAAAVAEAKAVAASGGATGAEPTRTRQASVESQYERQSLVSLMQMLSSTVQENGGDSDNDGEALGSGDGAEEAVALTPHERERTLSAGEGEDLQHEQAIGGESDVLMTEEERAVGSVASSVYRGYLAAAGGWPHWILLMVLFVAERLSYASTDWWLGLWTSTLSEDPSKQSPPLGMPLASEPGAMSRYMTIYVVIAAVNGFFVLCRTYYFVVMGLRASRSLFQKLLWSVLRSPMQFFETTPVGRVMNRFSFDTEVIDMALIQKMMESVASAYWILTAVVVLVGVTPWNTLVLLPVMFLYSRLQQYYRCSCRELQRLDAVSRSPIVAHFSESLAGLPTIRAYGQQQRFVDKSIELVDANSRAVMAYTSVARWLGVRSEAMGAFISLVTAMFCYLGRDVLPGGLAGFVLGWSFNLTVSLQFNVNAATEAEARMNSVERIMHYISLPSEAPLHVPEHEPPKSWPSVGAVVFDNVTLRYRKNLPPALKGFSASIKGGERIGICGRSGAGKSTIAAALFRLVELESGSISVDGLYLHDLGLADVRGRAVFIIPQDPTLLQASIRYNLDPFETHSDADIIAVLRKVRLGSLLDGGDVARKNKASGHGSAKAGGGGGANAHLSVAKGKDKGRDEATGGSGDAAAPSGLDTELTEGGDNLSLGERQLLCLARALLQKPKVLVLDEATAATDGDTDAFIQRIVRTHFADTTLLVIAHRLDSIMDSDRICVVDRGVVAELDTPAALLRNPGSKLSKMVAAGGPLSEASLRAMAGVERVADVSAASAPGDTAATE